LENVEFWMEKFTRFLYLLRPQRSRLNPIFISNEMITFMLWPMLLSIAKYSDILTFPC
jgi:hypothetical protein